MSFDPKKFSQQPGEKVSEDPFREVELEVAVRRLHCPHCGFTSVYRYHVQQIRRKDSLEFEDDREVRTDHMSIWKTVPRFAEVPETVKCQRCREVIGLDTYCIF